MVPVPVTKSGFRRHVLVMMSLWKLRVGAESYYLAQVASGLDEYYTGTHEPAGQWTGGAAPLLGLCGSVDGADLRAVLAGLAPDTGFTPNGTQLRAHPRRVPGFDLTFAVPKSVSVVYALGDPLVQAAVAEACEAAVLEAFGWLEREACFVRRGTNNRKMIDDPAGFGTRRMIADGFVAARFAHRTSRAGDPHLHWHVLVANMARGIDGRWSALDGTALYRAQRAAGVLFQTVMRTELTHHLGVEWGPVHNDAAEIAGVPTRVLREFSQRTEQIAEWMQAHGVDGTAAKNTALLETRTSKHLLDDFAVLEAAWRDRATALGWGPAQLDQLLANVPDPGSRTGGDRWIIAQEAFAGDGCEVVRVVDFEAWVEWLLTTRVTEKSGTFTRFDLAQAVAAILPTGNRINDVDRTVRRVLASPAVVQVGDHWGERRPINAPGRTIPDDREVRYTSRTLLTIEQRLLEQLATGTRAGIGFLDPAVIEAAITASTLGDDQATAIRVLATAGDHVAVMVGRAGTGKTHTLGTLRAIYQQAGWDVVGLAPSARAARELEHGSGIVSTTIARHLVEQREITSTTLVVVDESGMGGVRDIAAIIDQAARVGAKIVLVGDHHQLPEVSAGGAFRAALDTLGTRVVELTVNRRQQHEWEQAALDQLRHGDVATAFAAYQHHGRVVLADNPEQLHHDALDQWQDLSRTGDTLMLAGTRAEANLLNRQARQMLALAGLLDFDREFEIAGRAFAPGDRVVLCHNDTHQHLGNGEPFAVDNGMLATITGLDDSGLHVRLTNGEQVILDRGYVERGWVDHAYALTIHKAQGVTCDHIILVGPAGLYREAIYVALSRARLSAWIYATSAQLRELEQRHDTGIPLPTEHHNDPQRELLARMNTSKTKTLVTIDDPDVARIADLVAAIPAVELLRRARHATAAELDCRTVNPARLRHALDAAIAARTHLDVGGRVRAIDRDNIGTVTDIDDHNGTCTIHFHNTAGHSAIRVLDWTQLVVIDNPDTTTLSADAVTTITHRQAAVAIAEQQWATSLAGYAVTPGDADLYRRAVHTALDHAAHRLQAEPPEWLTTWLGARPNTAVGAPVWDDATTRIAHHRLLHDIADTEHGIGLRPAAPAGADRWHDLIVRLLEDRIWLADHPAPATTPIVPRTPSRLIDRRHELHSLLATAPADQRQLMERIANSALDASQMHECLTAAVAVQGERRDWIIAHWPHIVELEQITQLIATQQSLAHWPETQPPAVRDVLHHLRLLAPEVDQREERSLAAIDRQATDSDPVRRLENRHNHLQLLAAQTVSFDEQEALHRELVVLGTELRVARRDRTIEEAFNRYLPNAVDEARTARIATLAADTLTTQPTWVIAHVRQLHDNHQLATADIGELATRIITTAAHLDLHGQLPTAWPAPAPRALDVAHPRVEVGW